MPNGTHRELPDMMSASDGKRGHGIEKADIVGRLSELKYKSIPNADKGEGSKNQKFL